MVYNFFAQSSSTTYKGIGINSDVLPENQQLQKQLIENLKNKEYTHLLRKMPRVLILQVWN